jgi:phage terminase large subunit GpA-like protein
MVIDWLEACKSVPKLEVFTNTVLGEVWKPVEQIQYEQLTWLLETYPGPGAAGVLVLTAGVDVQKDRIEARSSAGDLTTNRGRSTIAFSRDRPAWIFPRL